MKRFKKIMILAITAIMIMTAFATTASASEGWKMGEYVDEVVPGEEYIIESVKFPGKVASPDRRAKYKDYITLTAFDEQHPYAAQQIWHFTNYDTKWVDDPMLGHYDVSFERPGMFMISNHTDYDGSWTQTLRLITYDSKKGYTAKFIEYNSDGSTADTQWFRCVKLYKKDGKQVWKITGVSSGTRVAPGGWSEVYFRRPE